MTLVLCPFVSPQGHRHRRSAKAKSNQVANHPFRRKQNRFLIYKRVRVWLDYMTTIMIIMVKIIIQELFVVIFKFGNFRGALHHLATESNPFSVLVLRSTHEVC